MTNTTNATTNGHGAPTTFAVDELLTDSAENLFGSTCTFDAVQAAEEAGWAPEIWAAIAEA